MLKICVCQKNFLPLHTSIQTKYNNPKERNTMEEIKKELEQIKRTLNEEARICETMLNGNECWTEVDCNVIIDLAKRLNKINL